LLFVHQSLEYFSCTESYIAWLSLLCLKRLHKSPKFAAKLRHAIEPKMTLAAINTAQALSARMAADPSKIGEIIDGYEQRGK